jgi:hypothetical protein
MNDSTERILKAWKLRQPSAELRSRIFASETEAAPAVALSAPGSAFAWAFPAFDWAGLFRWLVPAMGCFVLAGGAWLEPSFPAHAASPTVTPDQYLAMADSAHTDFPRNNVPATTLNWTFGRASSSSNGSFVRAEQLTNTLFK